MLSPKKLLENARNRITKRENWAKGVAFNTSGERVSPTEPQAISWCILGAIAAEAGVEQVYTFGTHHPEYTDAVHAVAQQLNPNLVHPSAPDASNLHNSPYSAIYTFNDISASHEQVLELLDNAIANMRGE